MSMEAREVVPRLQFRTAKDVVRALREFLWNATGAPKRSAALKTISGMVCQR